MLNLFKFPFRGRNSKTANSFPSDDISNGIIRNYLSRKNDLCGDKIEEASSTIANEMKLLQERLMQPGDVDRYDVIMAAFEKIDRRLQE